MKSGLPGGRIVRSSQRSVVSYFQEKKTVWGRAIHWTCRIGRGIIHMIGKLLFGEMPILPGKEGGMYFHFGTRKIIEAAAVLLRAEPGSQMGRLRLLKLLYIADRNALEETGRPIIGTRPVAMDKGPVHSEVLDLINGEHADDAEWAEFIHRNGRHDIKLVNNPGVLSLSRYEIEKLKRVSREYWDTEDWELVPITHAFPEWKDNYREGTAPDIPLEDILAAVGRSKDRHEIVQDAAETKAVRRLLGCRS